ESGTGAVHTAPGHGVDDFKVGQAYGLDVLNPVNSRGVFVEGVEHVEGMFVFKANETVLDVLRKNNALIAHAPIEHSYPHCWRHKTPIIFRATPQWFVGMHQNGLLNTALNEIESVSWLPEKGQARIRSMMQERPDWCISRQRSWGVPITVFYHKSTGEIHPNTLELLNSVANRVEQEGVDAWFDLDPSELLGSDHDDYEKATDILDVWFDSGASHACVLDARDGLSTPADLYLEGSDQHRGWFQSSLLIGAAVNGSAPFKQVLTHGFTVDADGRKMSKSARNGVAPQKLMKELGADVVRLWVASTDYKDDVSVSDEHFKRTADTYRRIRNTSRFLLSNLVGFEPSEHALPFESLLSLDQWIVSQCASLQEEIIAAYNAYQFHVVYQKVHHFCANELGGFYLSIVKDRLYTMPANSVGRRSGQTALFHLMEAMVRWIAPITVFTADEIWQAMMGEREESVHLSEWYQSLSTLSDDAVHNHAFWAKVQDVKYALNKNVEAFRNAGHIKSELSAELDLYCDDDMRSLFEKLGDESKFVLLSSNVSIYALSDAPEHAESTDIDGIKVVINVSGHKKCDRCWHHHPSVSQIAAHPELCERCVSNINGDGEERYYA
ncbi:MAG: class I tRNA ligase family protein, partial [Pseudomonadota bacterium]